MEAFLERILATSRLWWRFYRRYIALMIVFESLWVTANGEIEHTASPASSIERFSFVKDPLDPSSFGHEVKLSRKLRYLLFPEGSSTGIWVDFTIPLGLPDENVFVSMNFEANYNLPDNATQFPFALRNQRGVTRKRAYNAIESWLESIGMQGRSCLLRTICETTENTLARHSLASEIIHWLFTPSSSGGEWLNEDIRAAEELGRRLSTWEGGKDDVNCRTAYPSCPLSPFDLFTVEGEQNADSNE